MKKIGIIGAGASGLFAAINIKTEDNSVTILEKNKDIGRKILMTGNGRCNITNASFYDDFLSHIGAGKKFMYSSFASFDNYATMDYFENQGLALSIQENARVFPASEKSSNVNDFFAKELSKKNIKLVTEAEVTEVCKTSRGFVVKTPARSYDFDYLIIATGGLSYPITGSTGDGYRFARSFGHIVTKTYPSLVPIFFKDRDLGEIKAVSFESLKVRVRADGKDYETSGPVLLTKNFLSGPAILNLSASLVDKDVNSMSLCFYQGNPQSLDQELIALFAANPKKTLANTLGQLIAQALVGPVVQRAGIDINKKANQLRKTDRQALVDTLLNFKLNFDKFGGFNTAIITKGGIDLDSINPKTMESKLSSGLYFIGEVLDIDCLTGGYNLQIAFSTAKACAESIKEDI